VVHSDETSFCQGNGDRANPKETKGWLGVLATGLVKIFSVALSRAQVTAKTLLGETFKGILISDRYPAYNWLDVKQRQICWAHQSARFNGHSRTHWCLETNWSSSIEAGRKIISLVASGAGWHNE
jgi:transposase